MRRAAPLTLLLLALPVSGCIAADDDLNATGANPAGLVDPLAALEAGEPLANIELLGEFRDGGAQEISTWGDYVFADQGNAVTIIDVSDAANPEKVGVTPTLRSLQDVKSSDDGAYLFLADQSEYSGTPLAGEAQFTGGVYVIDVQDKASPSLASYAAVGLTRGPHMVFYSRYADGNEYVFAAAGERVSILEFDRAAASLPQIATYMPGMLAQRADPRVLDPYYGFRGWVHDMFVEREPDGSVLMYVAAWDAGLHLVDVTDPASPAMVGSWNAFPDGDEGNVHTVATAWIGDRRITVGSVEVGFLIVGGAYWAQGQDHSVLYVWDTTDPSDIQLLGTWDNPIDPTSGREMYLAGGFPGESVTSTHNIQVEDGRIYLAHYGLGVWVLDISTSDKQAAPEILAYYQEDGQSVWDVVLMRGVLYSSGVAGVLGLHFVGDVLGDAGITSRA